jgi:hypothetical protein
MNLDTAFRSIYGRAPSPEETNSFNRIGKELGIRDNDAIWAIAFLLGHHLDLAKQMPEQIDKLISQSLTKYASSLDRARRLAETELAVTKARIEETVGQAVVTSAQREIARAAQTVAQSTARKSWLQWLGSGRRNAFDWWCLLLGICRREHKWICPLARCKIRVCLGRVK